jgi:hypothetical protein
MPKKASQAAAGIPEIHCSDRAGAWRNGIRSGLKKLYIFLHPCRSKAETGFQLVQDDSAGVGRI